MKSALVYSLSPTQIGAFVFCLTCLRALIPSGGTGSSNQAILNLSKRLLEIYPYEKEGVLDKKLASLVNKKNGVIFSTKNQYTISKILKKIILKSNLNKKSKVSFEKHIKFTNKNFTLNKYKKVIDKLCAV